MATQRRTLKTPPPEATRKLFKTVSQYFGWIQTIHNQNKENETASIAKANIVRQLASRILIRARTEDAFFRILFQMPEGFPKRIAVKRLLTYNKPGEYTLSLPLVHNGPIRTFQMLIGSKHDLANGEALLQLHQSLTKEQKTVQRHALRNLLDENDYVSPNRIGAWLSHLFKKIVQYTNMSETNRYRIATQKINTKDGMAILITCSPKQDNDANVFTILLKIEVFVKINEMPWSYRFRHPFPRDFQNKDGSGRKLQKEIKDGFEKTKLAIYLRTPIHKATHLPDIQRLPTRAKTYLEYRIKRCGTAFTSKSLPESFSQLNLGPDHGDPRVWKINYVDVEKHILNTIKSEPRLNNIKRAFTMYDILASNGNRVVPKLNQKTKRAISLWLFKQGGDTLDDRFWALYSVLEMVSGCLDNGFCPAFCQPQENTLDPGFDDDEHWRREIQMPKENQQNAADFGYHHRQSSRDHSAGSGSNPEPSDEEEDDDVSTLFSVAEYESNTRPNTVRRLMDIIIQDNVKDAIHFVNIV